MAKRDSVTNRSTKFFCFAFFLFFVLFLWLATKRKRAPTAKYKWTQD